MITDLQDCHDLEFKAKEGKYFAYIKGTTTTLSNLDEAEFSVQGIGMVEKVRIEVPPQEEKSDMCLTITPVAECNEIYGCTNINSTNYNPSATVDDGSCIIPGCTDPNALNYNPSATIDDGSCKLEGCTDSLANNYNPSATIDDGSCEYGGGNPCDNNAIGFSVQVGMHLPPTILNCAGSCQSSGSASTNRCAGNGQITWVVDGISSTTPVQGTPCDAVYALEVYKFFAGQWNYHGSQFTGAIAVCGNFTKTFDTAANKTYVTMDGLGTCKANTRDCRNFRYGLRVTLPEANETIPCAFGGCSDYAEFDSVVWGKL